MLDYLTHFQKADPKLYHLIKSNQPIIARLNDSKVDGRQPFEILCDMIISQQLSIKAAETIYSRFLSLVGSDYSPTIVLNLSEFELRGVGLSFAKIKYVKDLSRHFTDGLLKLDLVKDSDLELIDKHTQVKGIGRWTAEMFLIAIGRSDVFSLGDLGLKKAMSRLYSLDMSSQDFTKKIQTLSAAYSPYRSLAARALWLSLDL